MRRASRTDENQAEIVAAMRKMGAEVTLLHRAGGGIPDLLVSFRQRWLLVEVKTDAGDLNKLQRAWINRQRAPVHVVRSALEAAGLLQMVRP